MNQVLRNRLAWTGCQSGAFITRPPVMGLRNPRSAVKLMSTSSPGSFPSNPRAESPIGADKSVIAYRRWLSDLGVS